MYYKKKKNTHTHTHTHTHTYNEWLSKFFQYFWIMFPYTTPLTRDLIFKKISATFFQWRIKYLAKLLQMKAVCSRVYISHTHTKHLLSTSPIYYWAPVWRSSAVERRIGAPTSLSEPPSYFPTLGERIKGPICSMTGEWTWLKIVQVDGMWFISA